MSYNMKPFCCCGGGGGRPVKTINRVFFFVCVYLENTQIHMRATVESSIVHKMN